MQASAAHHLNDETKERQIRQRLHRHDGGTGAPPARRVIALCTGLYAPRNGIAATVAVLCAASISGAIFLIVPAAANWMPELTPLAAAALAVETSVLAALYARRSLKLNASNPLVYAAPMGLMAILVACGRYALV